MTQPTLITLTTDFGHGSAYVAAMKGAILSVAPQARLLDLTHDIAPQDLRAAGLFLRDVLPYYPSGSIHVVVVDPGVGSDRALLLVEFQGSRLLIPDNGCWTLAVPKPDTVYRLNQPQFWRQSVAPTFHGRDILAPVAGHLALGVPLHQLGEPSDTWQRIELPTPVRRGDSIVGEILSVDRFGNLISNITASDVSTGHWQVLIAGCKLGEMVRTYSDRPAGSLMALVSSSGFVEVAVVAGSAAAMLNAGIGAVIEVSPTLASAASTGTTK